MKTTLIGLVLLMIVGVSQGQAGGYKVTRVIEVGPAASVQAGGSVKWSPDGTQIAFFAHNHLMVADTLGNSRRVAAISDAYPVRAEWASDTEFAVRLKGEKRADSTLYQLMVYDVESRKSRLLDEFWRHSRSLDPGNRYFSGPYVTLEGTGYFIKGIVTKEAQSTKATTNSKVGFDEEKLPLSSQKASALQLDHLFRRGTDGLYRVSWSGTDSTRLCKSSGGHGEVAVSRIGAYVFVGGMLIDREAGDTIDVREYAGPPPPNTGGCGFLRPMFNPVSPEILFQYYCEGEDPYVIDRVGTFNYETREFVLLDTLTAFGAWQLPEYSPNGRMIALTSGNKAYIVWREEQ